MGRGLQRACAAAAVTALALVAAPALAKTARCDIRTSDGAYAGPCAFTLAAGGSFTIDPVGRSDFFAHAKEDPGITDISVDVTGSRAEVSGLTTDGINSRWGRASRSAKDKACWIGDDFSICVY
ncbi:MAG TPA: hypothetical protein VN806_00485 [Caulobacteraceae bacterium]|nr:hypothetical protein [Caulobacteraceae bacterium]